MSSNLDISIAKSELIPLIGFSLGIVDKAPYRLF